jgi:hypothetical protein
MEKQSSFTGIDRATVLDELVRSTVLNGQVNTKPGMLSLFKIHSPVTNFGLFLLNSHRFSPLWKSFLKGFLLDPQIKIPRFALRNDKIGISELGDDGSTLLAG